MHIVIYTYNVRTKEHVVILSVGVRVKIWGCVKPLQAFSAAGKRLARWCYGRLKWQQPSPWAFYHTIKSQIRHPVASPVHTQTHIDLHSALLPAASLIMSPAIVRVQLVSLWQDIWRNIYSLFSRSHFPDTLSQWYFWVRHPGR